MSGSHFPEKVYRTREAELRDCTYHFGISFVDAWTRQDEPHMRSLRGYDGGRMEEPWKVFDPVVPAEPADEHDVITHTETATKGSARRRRRREDSRVETIRNDDGAPR